MEPQDILKFGIIPELIGRLPVITALDPLDKHALMNILTEPKNALTKQYQYLLALDGVDLVFEPDALEAIAEKTMERNTGARGLRSVLEEVVTNIMFDAPSDSSIEPGDHHPRCRWRTIRRPPWSTKGGSCQARQSGQQEIEPERKRKEAAAAASFFRHTRCDFARNRL